MNFLRATYTGIPTPTSLMCQIFHNEAYKSSGVSTPAFIFPYESLPLFYVLDLMS